MNIFVSLNIYTYLCTIITMKQFKTEKTMKRFTHKMMTSTACSKWNTNEDIDAKSESREFLIES